MSNQRGGARGGRGGYGGGPSGGGRGGGSFNGGGGGRGPGTTVRWTTVMPPPIVQDRALKEKFPTGWTELKEDSALQTYSGPPATSCREKIKVSVNHFPLSNFQLPTKVYHYEVSFERIREGDATSKAKLSPVNKRPRADGDGDARGQLGPRKLPKPLPQLILSYLMERIYNEHKFYGIVTDLSNNIYTTRPLEKEGIDMNPVVSLRDVDQDILQENDDGRIQVRICRSEQDVDSHALIALNEQLRSKGTWQGLEIEPSVRTVVEQVLNAVVKAFPRYKFLPLGRSNLIKWPSTTAEVMPLGSNVVCWKGVSAHIGMGWRPYLNVDVAHCAFLEDKRVLHVCQEIVREDASDLRNWRPWAFQEIKALLKNVKVYYSPAPGKKLGGPITDILRTSVSDTFFDFGGERISVFEYFKRQYNTRLAPKGPCLLIRNRCQVPAELCTIKKGQSYNRKLNEMQTREMLKCAKKDPNVLHREITQQMNNLATSSPITKEWGLEVKNQMLTFNETRVLHAPQLTYGHGFNENEGKGRASIVPADGSWDINTTSFHFLKVKPITSWGILVVGNCRLNERTLRLFEDRIVQCGKVKGLNFAAKAIPVLAQQLVDKKDDPIVARNNVAKLSEIFERQFMKKDPPCQIVFVVIPKKNSVLYSHVKQAAELNVGILTQCVISQNVEKCQPATIQNILLKVNSKLDGMNYIVTPPMPKPEFVDIVNCPMLIIGADVTHPPPGSSRRIQIGHMEKEVHVPSFAAVTGSIDRTGMPFMMDIRAQVKAGKGAAEVIQNFDAIVLKMLKQFEEKTKTPRTPEGIRPRKIIYYRDGVGEGQFPEVLHVEMNAIRNACKKLKDYDGEPYEPKITFVTVQKRHKTRFFAHTAQGQIINAPAGTVVDQEIIHPTQMDFFLQSHKGMMGTSRPTRYRVLWDDTGFTADQIQNLTYFLCYMYVRCTKSVKIPAPTYYAHWAAARAKALTEGMEEFYDDIPALNQKIRRHPNIINNFPMHFV